jgi:hypothetical protein
MQIYIRANYYFHCYKDLNENLASVLRPFLSGKINISECLINFPKSNKLLLSMLWEFKWDPTLYAKLISI